MTDTKKIELIQAVLTDAWEFVPDVNDSGYWRGILIALEAIVKTKENGQ